MPVSTAKNDVADAPSSAIRSRCPTNRKQSLNSLPIWAQANAGVRRSVAQADDPLRGGVP